jgi:hypothetical protein
MKKQSPGKPKKIQIEPYMLGNFPDKIVTLPADSPDMPRTNTSLPGGRVAVPFKPNVGASE